MGMTFDHVAPPLRAAGFDVPEGAVRVEARDGRTLVALPGDRLAWFADTGDARLALARERRVLRLLETRCAFAAPRVLYEASDGAFDVRASVPGAADPFDLYARIVAEPLVAERVGRALGAILAEQHTRIVAADAASWLPPRPSWPEPAAWIVERLPRVVAERALVERVERLLARYDAVAVSDDDRALVHGDLGVHNIAVDPDTSAVRGVFDYGDAAWADRHHDFRYLLLDVHGEALFDAALAAYEPATGRSLSRPRIALYNAACAASYLAYRDGVPPEQRWCGRTLAEDLAWTRAALARAGE